MTLSPSPPEPRKAPSNAPLGPAYETWMFRQLMDTAHVGILLMDAETRILRCSRHAAAFFGVDFPSLPGTLYLDYVLPEDRDSIRSHVRKLFSCETQAIDVDLQYPCGDGHRRWGHWNVQLCRDEHGTIQGMLGILTDLTSREEGDFQDSTEMPPAEDQTAQDALKQEWARLRTLFEILPGVVWAKDLEGVYMACNPLFEQLVGAREPEVIGKTDYDLASQERAYHSLECDQQVIQSKQPVIEEDWLGFAATGYRGLFEITRTPICNNHGQVFGVLGMARDITATRSNQDLLQERIKEQQCLYDIFALTEDLSLPVELQMQRVAHRIPGGLRHPDIANVRIEYAGQVCHTEGFAEAPWMHMTEATTEQGQALRMTVAYQEAWAGEDKNPFLEEESRLLKSIVSRLKDVLDRREAAKRLIDQEALLNTMFRQTTDSIALVDAKTGRFVEFNEAAYQGLGYSREEFARFFVWDIQGELTNAQVMLKTLDVIDGALAQMETFHRHKDGTYRFVDLTFRPVNIRGQTLICAVWQDITERKQQEEALKFRAERLQLYNELLGNMNRSEGATNGLFPEFARETTERLSRALCIARVSVWLYDQGSHQLTCIDLYDANAREHTGGMILQGKDFAHELAVLKGARYVDAHDPLTDPRTSGFVETYVKPLGITSMLDCGIFSGGQFRGVVCFEHVNRPHTWLPDDIAFGCQVADQMGMALLTSQRRETARALRQSESFLKHAQSLSHTGHWHMDLTSGTRTLTWSDEMCRIFGLDPGKTVTPEAFEASIHPEDQDLVLTAWKKALNGHPYEITHRIIAGGATRWVDVRGRVELDEDGKPVEGLGVVQDVSEKVLREQELEKYRWHLEELVASRTEELEKARAEAVAANMAKGAFVANMSHEIRTPMNAIIGFAHLMKRDPLSPRQTAYLERLSSAGRHLLQIINDILDFSKIEAQKIVLDIQDFEPARVLDHICSIVAQNAASKDLEILVRLIDLPPVLRGDHLRLGQIFLNLVSNAVKFTDKGIIEISARPVSETGDSVTVRFEVRDTGIGMTRDQIQHLFQPFEQADESMTRRFGGTGLGLAISKRLVTLMNGAMGVESEPGEGSLFWVEIPLTKSAVQSTVLADLASLKGMRTLIVDDLDIARESLCEIASEMGMRPEAVESAEAGLEALVQADQQGDPYQLLLIDWKMPKKNGLEMASQIQGLPLRCHPRLMLVSAYGDQIPHDEVSRAGIAQILAKPVTPSVLFDALSISLLKAEGLGGPEVPEDIEPALALRSGASILLAEDNEINQEVACQMLESVGMRVSVAGTGLEALEMAGLKAYDLVLMDVQMPVMDGLQATQAIRRLPGWEAIPILAMTANAFEEDRERCVQVGMNDHLPKPVEPQALYRSLVKWLPEQKAPYGGIVSGSLKGGSELISPEQLDLLSVLETLDGLNASAGLNRLLGNVPRYIGLLEQFLSNHGNDAARLAEQLEANDLEGVRHTAHALKGVAGLLGAHRTQEKALHLEKAVRQKENAQILWKRLQDLNTALTSLVRDLQQVLPQQPAQAEAGGEVDRPKAIEILDNLEALLASDNTWANDLFEQSRDLLAAALGDAAKEIGLLIRDFDYAEALKMLKEARTEMGMKAER